MEDTIAIIPAKGSSLRVPHKNTRPVNEKPLWYWSVAYACNEGFVPVVSTDSDVIIGDCKKINVAYVRETVDDSKMSHCIRQVLDQDEYKDIKWVVILQPTSPIRKAGQLHSMMKWCRETGRGSYTAQKVKPQGRILGNFNNCFRSQDQKDWIYAFDGNILICNADAIRNGEELLTPESAAVVQDAPFNMQVDTEQELLLMQRMCSSDASYLPFPAHKPVKKVVVISNKHDYKRNYAEFIDSCDVVVRVNKMNALSTGVVGRRCDMCVSASWHRTLMHSPEERKDALLRQIPRVYYLTDPLDDYGWREHKRLVGSRYSLAAEYPFYMLHKTITWTSFARAAWLVRHMFPSAQLYVLCDYDVVLRSGNAIADKISAETEWLQGASADIVNINEEAVDGDGLYSRPLTPQEQELVQLNSAEVTAAERRVTVVHDKLKEKLHRGESVYVGPYLYTIDKRVYEATAKLTEKK